MEVEPPFLPIRVVGSHGAWWVQLLARVPQRERQAGNTNHLTRLCLTRSESVKLRAEEMNPEIPVHRDPRNPS
jgi:hypothetical protein